MAAIAPRQRCRSLPCAPPPQQTNCSLTWLCCLATHTHPSSRRSAGQGTNTEEANAAARNPLAQPGAMCSSACGKCCASVSRGCAWVMRQSGKLAPFESYAGHVPGVFGRLVTVSALRVAARARALARARPAGLGGDCTGSRHGAACRRRRQGHPEPSSTPRSHRFSARPPAESLAAAWPVSGRQLGRTDPDVSQNNLKGPQRRAAFALPRAGAERASVDALLLLRGCLAAARPAAAVLWSSSPSC